MPKLSVLFGAALMGLCFAQSGTWGQTDEEAVQLRTAREQRRLWVR